MPPPRRSTHQVGVGRVEVRGAVLEAHQVARRPALAGQAEEPALRPAQCDGAEADPRQVALRVVGDLRIVRTHLQAEVAVGMAGDERVAGEMGERRQLLGPLRLEAEPVEERRPEPERHRQPCGWQAVGLAGVDRRRPLVALDPAQRTAARHQRRGGRPLAHQAGHVVARRRRQVERREAQVRLLRRRDPRLVVAVELDRVGDGRAAVDASRSPRPRRQHRPRRRRAPAAGGATSRRHPSSPQDRRGDLADRLRPGRRSTRRASSCPRRSAWCRGRSRSPSGTDRATGRPP